MLSLIVENRYQRRKLARNLKEPYMKPSAVVLMFALLLTSLQSWAVALSVQEQLSHDVHASVEMTLTDVRGQCDTAQSSCEMPATSCQSASCVMAVSFTHGSGPSRLAKTASMYSFQVTDFISPPRFIPPIV